MFAKRDWATLALITMAQIGLVVCFLGLNPQFFHTKTNSGFVEINEENHFVPGPTTDDSETPLPAPAEQTAQLTFPMESTGPLLPAAFEPTGPPPKLGGDPKDWHPSPGVPPFNSPPPQPGSSADKTPEPFVPDLGQLPGVEQGKLSLPPSSPGELSLPSPKPPVVAKAANNPPPTLGQEWSSIVAEATPQFLNKLPSLLPGNEGAPSPFIGKGTVPLGSLPELPAPQGFPPPVSPKGPLEEKYVVGIGPLEKPGIPEIPPPSPEPVVKPKPANPPELPTPPPPVFSGDLPKVADPKSAPKVNLPGIAEPKMPDWEPPFPLPAPVVKQCVAKSTPPALPPAVLKKHGPPVLNDGPSPWQFQVAIIDQRTVLTAKTEKGATFVIRCSSLNLTRPGGNVEASGKVEIEGKNLQGNCDRLIITWGEDRLFLEGNATLKRWANGELIELGGPQLQFHMSTLQQKPLSPSIK